MARAANSEDREELRDRADLRIGALGDGSDYTAFLDYAGVAALNMGFGGESNGGVYHSIYDDFYWYTHFGDTKFVYERALAQMAGSTVMRFADADLLPFDPSGSADTVKRYIGELKKELKQKQDEARERNREVEEGVFTATSDPEKQYVPPPKQPLPPYLNFAPLENGAEAYARAAQRYRQAVARLNENGGAIWQSPTLKEINAKLILTERTFTVNQGLKERPWFKHQIYAPGAYTGYGAKTIPAVREAMEENKWQDADEGAVIVGQVLMKEASLVDSIAQELEQAEGQPPATHSAQAQSGASNTAEAAEWEVATSSSGPARAEVFASRRWLLAVNFQLLCGAHLRHNLLDDRFNGLLDRGSQPHARSKILTLDAVHESDAEAVGPGNGPTRSASAKTERVSGVVEESQLAPARFAHRSDGWFLAARPSVLHPPRSPRPHLAKPRSTPRLRRFPRRS